MRAPINLYGFRKGGKELVFDRVVSLEPETLRPFLNPQEIADDPEIANPYEIEVSAVATLLGEPNLPEGTYFANQVQSGEPVPG